MKLYLSEITDSVKKRKVDECMKDEVFNFGTKLKKFDITTNFYRAGETVLLSFAGTFEFDTVCARCAEEIAVETDVSEDFHLFPEVSCDEADYFYSGDHIDLEPFLRDVFVMNIPASVCCGEMCSGICPVCGGNMNNYKCNCRDKEGV